MKHSTIRSIQADDLPFLIDVVNSSKLFPGEMLKDMIGDLDGPMENDQIWLTYETDRPVAVAHVAPEKMTSGTWNLYLIAVHADRQGTGIGGQLMQYVERLLKEKDARLLIVETSDLDEFSLTRQFYTGLGYEKEAHIREFYDYGEGKVVFWKKL